MNFMATLTLWLVLWAVEHVRCIFVVDYGLPNDIHIIFNVDVSQRQLNALEKLYHSHENIYLNNRTLIKKTDKAIDFHF